MVSKVVVTGVTEKGYKRLYEFANAELEVAHRFLDELGAPGTHYDALQERVERLKSAKRD